MFAGVLLNLCTSIFLQLDRTSDETSLTWELMSTQCRRNVSAPFQFFVTYLHSEPRDPLAAGLSKRTVSICTTGRTCYSTKDPHESSVSYSSVGVTWGNKVLSLAVGSLKTHMH